MSHQSTSKHLRSATSELQKPTSFIDRWAWLLILGATFAFLLWQLDFGWIPNDDGTLAHAADRVRQGQIPHLDFDEPYPGLSSFLNAVTLSVFGDNLLSLRYPFVFLVGCWMVLSYGLARRALASVWAALTVSVMAVCVFFHMSPMPTWYIVILGTAATYCVVRHNDTERVRWLLLAGLLIGIATLIKTTAFLAALAVGMFLAIRRIRTGRTVDLAWGRGLLILGVLAVTVFLALGLTIERVLLFLVPLGMLVAVEWRPPIQSTEVGHPRHVISELAVVTAGVLLPIAAYAAAFWRLGALQELARAVLFTPGIYFDQFNQNVPGLLYALATVVAALIVWRIVELGGRARDIVGVGVVLLLAVVYILNPTAAILAAYTPLLWLNLLLGAVYLWRWRDRPVPLPTVAVVLAAYCFQLVRFPTSNQYYLIHGLPLAVLGLSMLMAVKMPRATQVTVLCLLAFVGILAMAKADGRMFAGLTAFEPDPYVALEMGRGGLRVPGSTAYINDVVEMVENQESTDVALAGPDSPEVYYLARVDNRTPVFFDFLSQARDDSISTDRYLHELLPDVFVNNLEPARSDPVSETRIPASCRLAGSFGPREVYVDCG
jgi:hypothetical protein